MLYRSIFHIKQFRFLGAFYLHSLIRLFAISIFQIFSSIYIFQIFRTFLSSDQKALTATAFLYAILFLIHALSIAPSLWLMKRKGLRFAVYTGNILLIAFFIFLYLAKLDPIFLLIAPIAGGMQLGLYWTAYHIYLTELTDDKKQGEEIALSVSLYRVASIGGPSFGGLMITYAGFGATFLVLTMLVLLANLPLRYLPKTKDGISFDLKETLSALSPIKESKSYLSLLGTSAIEIMAIAFWPLFAFSVVADFVGLGFMGSLIALFSTIATILIGYFIDKYGAKRVILVFSSLDSLSWALKAFATLPWHIFTAAGVQGITIPGQQISLDTLIYKRGRHTNIVAYIVQRELGFALGKACFVFILGVLFWFGVTLPFAFIITGLVALLTRLYPDEAKNMSSNPNLATSSQDMLESKGNGREVTQNS